MDSQLKTLLNKYHLKLKFLPMDRKGYLVGNVVFVKESLSDSQIEKVILHEIGHAKNDPDVIGDKTNCSADTCRECGANRFMMEQKIKQYVAEGNEPDEANYANIAVSLGLSNLELVREELLKYVAK
ncbi:ImmA/IrrE family metallo-endopeptidase [Lactobacillus hominis]|uniref:ImmA/IrrE family metallo-endopeptidase n=1 Tax=Lactobacillus hominis TaxID=1203033 RepID=UPI0023F05080|nr:ImmA/IrrE family metallo-endopeptidase [Lactobacillus hominis]